MRADHMVRRLVAGAAMLLAACSAEPGAVPADPPAAVDQPATEDAATTAVRDSAHLALEGEGLRVFVASSGSARPIPFGTSRADVMRAVSTVQGSEPRDSGSMEDCGVDYAAWADLTLYFTRDELVGWSTAPGSRLTTASGIGVGSTRRQLEDAYDADVAESTIGIEFSAGDLAGVLESEAPYARILHMWAGATCIAR